MFVRNCWYVAAWTYELDAFELASRTIMDQAIVLYRAQDGSVVGLEDRCCHRFAPLSKGRREGDDIRCMYHGFRYGKNGICNDVPGQKFVPPKARVKTYPVVEKHSWIWVWMGDSDKADEQLIPPAVGLDDQRYTLRSGKMDYKANYLLINDNLTDFSHLPFIHEKSFQAPEDWAREVNPTKRIPRGIRVERWIEGNSIAGEVKKRAPGDAWSTYDFLVPGVLLMYTATFPLGTAKASRFGPPTSKIAPVNANFTSQAVTPISDRTSRYFYSWGPTVGKRSEMIADKLLDLANIAFTEDRLMIEAQQEVIDRNPASQQVLTTHDKGPTLMRRIIEELASAERRHD
jgi:vanillate O-demethylase monooxygenase subunit